MERVLNVQAQFVKHAKALLEAVDDGKQTHASSNIGESGKPFENQLRQLFKDTLPNVFQVLPGFFFDCRMLLSNQVDVLICDQTELLKLPPNRDLEQSYILFNSVRVMLQLKNSAGCLSDALGQSAKAITAWRTMKINNTDFASSNGLLVEPLSIVVIGRGGDESSTRKVLQNFQGPLPAYLLLLEQGLFYGKESVLARVAEDQSAYFSGQQNGGPLALLELDGNQEHPEARMLMWLFFAVLHQLQSKTSTSAFEALIKRVQHDYPLRFSELDAIHQTSITT